MKYADLEKMFHNTVELLEIHHEGMKARIRELKDENFKLEELLKQSK